MDIVFLTVRTIGLSQPKGLHPYHSRRTALGLCIGFEDVTNCRLALQFRGSVVGSRGAMVIVFPTVCAIGISQPKSLHLLPFATPNRLLSSVSTGASAPAKFTMRDFFRCDIGSSNSSSKSSDYSDSSDSSDSSDNTDSSGGAMSRSLGLTRAKTVARGVGLGYYSHFR